MPLSGLQVVSLESRRAELVETLVRQQGGECFNAPSVRELPLEENTSCLDLARDLIADVYDALVLTTGVGAQCMIDAARSVEIEEPLLTALARTQIVSRGPKPVAVLRQYGIRATLNVPEPNTWREVAEQMSAITARKVAIQEYGVPNPELNALLADKGYDVTSVPIYRWALPVDIRPIEEAARRIAAGACDIVLFLSSVQLTHLLEVAERRGLRELVMQRLAGETVICSIGPVMNDALARHGLAPDFIPKHPKLAICIRQLAESAPALVMRKRAASG